MTDSLHYLVLVALILFCGLLGGLINFLRLPSQPRIWFGVMRSILTGLGASALVPLFLNTISSDLLLSSKNDPLDYFVIGGFCLLSAIFSSKFIDSMGEKVIQDLNRVSDEVKEVRNDLDDISIEKDISKSEGTNLKYSHLTENESQVLWYLYSSRFTYRSATGLAAETRLSREDVNQILEKLIDRGYVDKFLRKNGWIRWRLTERGREVIAESFGDEGS